MSLLRNIYSDWMKTKNTPIRLIIYIVPVVYASLLLWYTSRISTPKYIYGVFFQLMSVCFPIAESLLCALVCKLEEDAGGFNNMLGAYSRITAYLSKFLMIVLITIFVVIESTILLLVGMKFILHISNIQYIQFLSGTCLSVLGCLFLIELHLVLSFAFGLGASMAVGGAGFLAAAMIGGSIAGENIWIYFPWSWSIRLSSMIEYYNEQIIFSCSIVTIVTTSLLLLSIIWFSRWEGKKAYE